MSSQILGIKKNIQKNTISTNSIVKSNTLISLGWFLIFFTWPKSKLSCIQILIFKAFNRPTFQDYIQSFVNFPDLVRQNWNCSLIQAKLKLELWLSLSIQNKFMKNGNIRWKSMLRRLYMKTTVWYMFHYFSFPL